MMKFLILVIIYMFMFNLINYYLIQIFYQNLLFLMSFLFLILSPLNNMNIWVNIYDILGYDCYSMFLIILSFWVMGIMILVSYNSFLSNESWLYLNVMNFMLLSLLSCFLSMNMLMFFIFFESSLIPIFVLIMGWGFNVERIQAGFFMMIYTMFGSMPLFYFIMNLNTNEDTLMFSLVKFDECSLYYYITMILAFLIKMPMYMLHLWLPKAHVEAPLTGSMILAGVMLKLGSYGVMRFMLISSKMCLKFNKYLMIVSLMGGVYSSFICLYQVDMKKLVAYSSVVHMSLLLSSMLTMYHLSYVGSIYMMVAHGLCSSGMFCLVNINYERLGSRSLMLNKGLINFFPSFSLMWFLMCSSNLSFPPSLNLFSEIILLSTLIMWNKNFIILLMLMLFLGATYSLYLFSFTQFGIYNKLFYFMKSITLIEYLIILFHWLPLNFLFMYMYMY